MLLCKREIRDVMQSISNMNEHVLFDRLFKKSDGKLMFWIRRFKKISPYSVSWRIRNINSNLISYPSAEKREKQILYKDCKT